MIGAVLAAASVLAAPPPALTDLSVTNGSTPFAGDGRLLTTVSPNRDGFRDAATVRFRVTRAATVRMEIVATNMVRAVPLVSVTFMFTAQFELICGPPVRLLTFTVKVID